MKVSSVERGADVLLRQIETIGPRARDWSRAMVQARDVEGACVLVAELITSALEKACEKALGHGAYRLRMLHQLLKRQAQPPDG